MSEYSREDYWYNSNGSTITGKAKNSLTDEEAAQYTIANVLAGDGSSNAATGVWNPLPIVEKTEAPVVSAGNGEATWEAVPYAICYVVTVNGKAVAFPTEPKACNLNVGDVVSVQSVNEFGALSEMSQQVAISEATGIKTIGEATAKSIASEFYTPDGKRIGQLKRGLNIVKMSDGRVVKIIKD